MAEEFSGLGSSIYIGLPGQPFEEMHEVKVKKVVQSLIPSVEEPCEWKDEQEELRGHPKQGYQLTFGIRPEKNNPALKALRQYAEQSRHSCKGFARINSEATILVASWLAGGRCIARYNRLRRHYNRWRRSYATRKTFYAPPFNKFLHCFMVHYVGMRNYSSDQSHNED